MCTLTSDHSITEIIVSQKKNPHHHTHIKKKAKKKVPEIILNDKFQVNSINLESMT